MTLNLIHQRLSSKCSLEQGFGSVIFYPDLDHLDTDPLENKMIIEIQDMKFMNKAYDSRIPVLKGHIVKTRL